ncbi:hypothetical protein L6452_41937 [Arctium lappa]|uniref:Uncharacterized protein n=1 Tax=Arctium lappa TaxID=4217 RepID=A0ACB8XH36_ARCLA|nr:hypothetical protein L6452_41937 [Arctium lappa]
MGLFFSWLVVRKVLGSSGPSRLADFEFTLIEFGLKYQMPLLGQKDHQTSLVAEIYGHCSYGSSVAS